MKKFNDSLAHHWRTSIPQGENTTFGWPEPNPLSIVKTQDSPRHREFQTETLPHPGSDIATSAGAIQEACGNGDDHTRLDRDAVTVEVIGVPPRLATSPR
jgi:hypothetical protein